MLAEPRFRESLPAALPGAPTAVAALRESCAERLATLLGESNAQSALKHLWDHFLGNLDALPQDGLSDIHKLDRVTLQTRVARRDGAFAHIGANGDATRLTFPGSGFDGSPKLEPLFRFLSETTTFRVFEMPEDLCDDDKIAVTCELIREGFLCVTE